MPTTMPTKRLGMYHVHGPTLKTMMHTMDSGLGPQEACLARVMRQLGKISLPEAMFDNSQQASQEADRQAWLETRLSEEALLMQSQREAIQKEQARLHERKEAEWVS
ncbi:unnamed protein product [Protopolystoma xenopodis]|uniref:Uncharacterized protein n=1 Tax=Protopolystoma xenopodis TaxID=117903 RepID=A0A3S5BW79_9PLAT|nr:unnamed protein product [Protopolystoma xenopodis]